MVQPFVLPLSAIHAGERVQIFHLEGSENGAARLRDLGLREGCTLQVIRNDRGRMIIGLDSNRVGVARDLATRVFVQSAAP